MTALSAFDWLEQASAAIRDPSQPEILYQIIDRALNELVGYKLLTILRLRGDRLYRMHTSDLAKYPVGGFKSIANDAWLKAMLSAGVPIISPNPELVQQRFFDHETIFSLGCGSVMNVPVVGPTGTLGSLNLLHELDWFESKHVLVARPFATLLALAWSAEEPG